MERLHVSFAFSELFGPVLNRSPWGTELFSDEGLQRRIFLHCRFLEECQQMVAANDVGDGDEADQHYTKMTRITGEFNSLGRDD